MASHFPDWSPYAFAFDNPIAIIDENGEYGDDPRAKFYKTMGTSAMKAITATNVNANKYKAMYALAQYRMENGFNLTPPGNNPFNIKGKGDVGQVTYVTTEYIKGKKTILPQSFASFSSLEKGFEGYLKLLESNFPNASTALFGNDKTVTDFANGLMKGRLGAYATGPNYAANMKGMLAGVVKDYEKNIIGQISGNNDLIRNNNAIITLKTGTKEEKQAAANRNSELGATNKNLVADLNKLKEFKKDEGIK